MYLAESVEDFKKRVENGLGRGTTYHNSFARLNPADRVIIRDDTPAEKQQLDKVAIILELL